MCQLVANRSVVDSDNDFFKHLTSLTEIDMQMLNVYYNFYMGQNTLNTCRVFLRGVLGLKLCIKI